MALCLSWALSRRSTDGPEIQSNSSSVALFLHAVKKKKKKERAKVSWRGSERERGGRNYLPVTGDDEENLGNDPERHVLWGGKRDWDVNTHHRPLIRR